jgi:copper chaperone CopZ
MTTFAVPDMSCDQSRLSIEDALAELDPEAVIEADVDERTLRVSGGVPPAVVLSVLSGIGFAANVAC